MTFHALSCRMCMLRVRMATKNFAGQSCSAGFKAIGLIFPAACTILLQAITVGDVARLHACAHGLHSFQRGGYTIWKQYAIPIGMDHRCMNCVLRARHPECELFSRRPGLKGWRYKLDSEALRGQYHLATRTVQNSRRRNPIFLTLPSVGCCMYHKFVTPILRKTSRFR